MTLEQKTIIGVKWSGISQIFRQGSQIITSIILARLLAPEDFGLLGMALVFTGLVAIFNDFGIGSAIVQKQNLDDKNISSIFWFSLLIGFFVLLIIIAAAPFIAIFFNQSALTPIISVMSLSFIFISLSTVQNSLLLKNLKFKKLTFLEVFSTIFSGVLGISLAFLGYGVWSLVWQSVTATIVYTLLVWITNDWKPKLYFDWKDIKSIIGFTGNLSGFNLLNYFSRNADKLLIGKFLGAIDLGYYILAYTIMLYPLSNISSVLSKVMFPTFSQIQHDNFKFRLFYLKLTKYIAFITFPLMLGLFAVANEFISTIYSEKWAPVIFLIKVLSIIGLGQSIGTTVGSIYLSKGKTDWMFRWGIFSSIIVVGAILIGMRWGINGVAISYAIASLLLTYPSFAIPFRLINLKFKDFVLNLKEEAATSLIMFIIVMAVLTIQRHFLFSSKIILISSIAIGVMSYLVAVIAINNSTYKELKNHILSKGD
jgi:O-antigen/teichoic acid export membrane protein